MRIILLLTREYQSIRARKVKPLTNFTLDSTKTQKDLRRNKRLKEVSLSEKRNKECTFKPQKVSKLGYEYLEDFKDPNTRLYNNYFEIQDKMYQAREDRDKELRSMSETRTPKTINFSITNNFINSSINISTRDYSSKKSRWHKFVKSV